MMPAPDYKFTCRLDPKKLKPGTTAEDLTKLYSYKGTKPVFSEDRGFIVISLNTKGLEDVNMIKAVGFMVGSEDGREEDAIRNFNDALEKCPFLSEAYRGKARMLLKLGKEEEAMDCLILALKYDHGNVWALLDMGNLLQRKGDDRNAEMYFREILRFDPKHYIATYNLGHLRMKEKRYDDAEPYFLQAIDNDPKMMEAYYGMTFIEGERGHFLEAFEWARKGLLFGKSKTWTLRMEEELTNAYIAAANSHIEQQPVSQLYELARQVEQKYDCSIRLAESKDIDNGALLQQSADEDGESNFEILYNPDERNYSIHLLNCITYAMISRYEQMNEFVGMYEGTPELKDKFVNDMLQQVDEAMKRQTSDDIIRKMLALFYEDLLNDMYQLATDMVMEAIIFEANPEFRPHAFIAHLGKLPEQIKNQNATRHSHVPATLIKAMRIMSLQHALFVKKHYGFDAIHFYELDDGDNEAAEDIYGYFEYLIEQQPLHTARYHFIKYLARETGLDKYFTIQLAKQL